MVGPPYPHTAGPRKTLCVSCQYGGKHCLGTAAMKCECDCAKHTLEPEDFRMDMIALMTAEAHREFAMLKTLIEELDDEKLKAVCMLLVKYTGWMMRVAGVDPVKAVQEAALFWSGGDTPAWDDDEDGDDDFYGPDEDDLD